MKHYSEIACSKYLFHKWFPFFLLDLVVVILWFILLSCSIEYATKNIPDKWHLESLSLLLYRKQVKGSDSLCLSQELQPNCQFKVIDLKIRTQNLAQHEELNLILILQDFQNYCFYLEFFFIPKQTKSQN